MDVTKDIANIQLFRKIIERDNNGLTKNMKAFARLETVEDIKSAQRHYINLEDNLNDARDKILKLKSKMRSWKG